MKKHKLKKSQSKLMDGWIAAAVGVSILRDIAGGRYKMSEEKYITKKEFDEYKEQFWKKGIGKWFLDYSEDKSDQWNVWRRIMWNRIFIYVNIFLMYLVLFIIFLMLLKLEANGAI